MAYWMSANVMTLMLASTPWTRELVTPPTTKITQLKPLVNDFPQLLTPFRPVTSQRLRKRSFELSMAICPISKQHMRALPCRLMTVDTSKTA